MSAPNRSFAGLDARRRRIRFRAWHRGTREMDLILGTFCDSEIERLTDVELDEFERLIEAPDQDLYGWVTGSEPIGEGFDTLFFRRILDFHHRPAPRIT
jgi:antitoxin CptB